MKLKQQGYRSKESAYSTLNPWVVKSLAILLGVSFALSGTAPASELFYEEVEAATYEDFTDSGDIKDYAKPYINYLVDDSIQGIKGYTDGSFKPDSTVSKLEFLSMTLHSCASDEQLQGIINEAKKTMDFYEGKRMSRYDAVLAMYPEDVVYQWGDQSRDLIVIANYLSLETGTTFMANVKNPYSTPITREYAASVMSDAYEYFLNNKQDIQIDKNINSIQPKDGWGSHAEEAQKLYQIGVLQGNEKGEFLSTKSLTRAEASVMVAKLRNSSFRKAPTLTNVETTTETTTAAVTPGTLDLNDPNRRDAVAGDKVVVNGKTIVLTEKFGVVGAEQPVAVDIGRKALNGETVQDHHTVMFPNQYCDTYIVSPQGEGHFLESWSRMIEGYCDSVQNPVKGQTYTFGLGGWCKITWKGLSWSVVTPDWLPIV